MTFASPFSRVIQRPFGGVPSSAVVPWYLSGGIASANCIGAYQAKGAADIAASYVNLANPGTYNLTTADAPSFNTSSGWTFNGTSDHLNTGITAENDQSWTLVVRGKSTNDTGYRGFIGSYYNGGSYQGIAISAVWLTDQAIIWNGATIVINPSIVNEGVFIVTGNKFYIDGTKTGADIGSLAGTFYPISIGALQHNTSKFAYLAGYIYAAAIYDVALSQPQVTALTTALAAL